VTAGEDDPTEDLGSEDETKDTDILFPSMAKGSPEEMRTRRLAEKGPGGTGEDADSAEAGDGSRGVWMLVISISVSLLLVAGYIAAGGLDYKPAKAADPCKVRASVDPSGVEETVQKFALSAVDGAACELGVSREELTRALADKVAREKFAEDNGLTDQQVEDALRAGINRAIDEAEASGAIGGLAAAGMRVVVRALPVNQLIPLIEDASSLFEAGGPDGNTLNDAGGFIDGIIEGLNDTGASVGDSLPGDLSKTLPKDLTEDLRDRLPPEIERNIPDSLDESIQKSLDDLLNP
jgi:hypothetical protein